MRSFVSFLGGAVSVGLVVGVLALAGVIDDNTATTSSAAAPPSPTTSAPGGSSPSAKATDISQIYKRVSPGVVFVEAGQTAAGSGFVFDQAGHIVTNDHVVEGANSFQVRIGADNKVIPATLVGKDPSSDLAVLKVDPGQVPGGLKPLELGDSTKLEPGDEAIAIGSPLRPGGTGPPRPTSSLAA